MQRRINQLETDSSASNLLRCLADADVDLLRPGLETWQGSAGDVLYRPGDVVRFVYFPCGPSLVSFRIELADGRAVETALVGREGAVGGIVSRGRLPAYARAEVQSGGSFLRMLTVDLEEAKMRSPTLRHFFARYADCLLAQVFQTTACNAGHSIEQRTAKWILAAIDRTGDHEIPLTQDQLAGMLGVGRSYISRVLSALKARAILTPRRGRLIVSDMHGLKMLSCDCNDMVRRHFDEVLAGVYPRGDDAAPAHSDCSG
ncbi:CRP-like cAMP-binding protein [Tepidamorphus gemmatus]|uniref:CRP-like cAMP-binding protein n=1 Tax=Tepidamorphus gemmatus TaxID=747076 RepID=A0A4R3MI43_9HYPH|nr:Crp/Fnr family transcriptional regulator [Tepidamorphus gemmatus]TCT13531.1 CRP-like cAMP-binding protein [Tepidamorphus gemmatus]